MTGFEKYVPHWEMSRGCPRGEASRLGPNVEGLGRLRGRSSVGVSQVESNGERSLVRWVVRDERRRGMSLR